jgi:hypothetical protein
LQERRNATKEFMREFGFSLKSTGECLKEQKDRTKTHLGKITTAAQ